MTSQETSDVFEAFKRSIAKSAVKFKQGVISGEDLYEDLVVTLGRETFKETEDILAELKSKAAQ